MLRTLLFISCLMNTGDALSGTCAKDSVTVGRLAPDFLVETVDGRDIHMSDLRGKPVLLSFIHVHPSSQAEGAQATRAQMTFLKSMVKQFEDSGLKLVLIAAQKEKKRLQTETFVNFMYDHELTDVPFLSDEGHKVAESYGVDILPTTFLISKSGTISQRWNNVALTGQLALAIEDGIRNGDGGGSPAQLIFPGLPGAWQLSEKMWMVDGGKTWKHGDPQPFRLIFLTQDSVRIKLDIFKEGQDQPVRSEEFLSEAIPPEECSILISNLSIKTTQACSAVSSLTIAESGNYLFRVNVSKPDETMILHSASINIRVQ